MGSGSSLRSVFRVFVVYSVLSCFCVNQWWTWNLGNVLFISSGLSVFSTLIRVRFRHIQFVGGWVEEFTNRIQRSISKVLPSSPSAQGSQGLLFSVLQPEICDSSYPALSCTSANVAASVSAYDRRKEEKTEVGVGWHHPLGAIALLKEEEDLFPPAIRCRHNSYCNCHHDTTAWSLRHTRMDKRKRNMGYFPSLCVSSFFLLL